MKQLIKLFRALLRGSTSKVGQSPTNQKKVSEMSAKVRYNQSSIAAGEDVIFDNY